MHRGSAPRVRRSGGSSAIRFDAIIVGGGPAGSSLRAGARPRRAPRRPHRPPAVPEGEAVRRLDQHAGVGRARAGPTRVPGWGLALAPLPRPVPRTDATGSRPAATSSVGWSWTTFLLQRSGAWVIEGHSVASLQREDGRGSSTAPTPRPGSWAPGGRTVRSRGACSQGSQGIRWACRSASSRRMRRRSPRRASGPTESRSSCFTTTSADTRGTSRKAPG